MFVMHVPAHYRDLTADLDACTSWTRHSHDEAVSFHIRCVLFKFASQQSKPAVPLPCRYHIAKSVSRNLVEVNFADSIAPPDLLCRTLMLVEHSTLRLPDS